MSKMRRLLLEIVMRINILILPVAFLLLEKIRNIEAYQLACAVSNSSLASRVLEINLFLTHCMYYEIGENKSCLQI